MSTATEPSKTETPTNGTTPPTLPAAPPKREIRVVQDDGPLAHLFDTARFEHTQRIATILGDASTTPVHLKGKTARETLANCFKVTNQAIRWGADPFAVADETYVVGNRLGYQGKLVAAIVNTRARLVGRLRYEFSGAGDNRQVTVIGRFEDEDLERTIDLAVGQAKTANKMWTVDPDQKLVYSGVVKWARRHCPEVVMGILTDDDIDRISTRAIIEGPSTELPSKSEEVLARLGGPLEGEIGGPADDAELPAQESEAPAQAPSASEPTDHFQPYEDLFGQYSVKLDDAASRNSIIDVEAAAEFAKKLQPDLPEFVVKEINRIRDETMKEIREKRGAGSNKA